MTKTKKFKKTYTEKRSTKKLKTPKITTAVKREARKIFALVRSALAQSIKNNLADSVIFFRPKVKKTLHWAQLFVTLQQH